jgi:hypothetical protein
MDWKHRSLQAFIVLLFCTLLAFAGVLIFFLYQNPNQYFAQDGLLRRIEVLVAGLAFVANIGLTAVLIYVYLNQNRVLREEMSVLRGQQELMEKEQQPEIDEPYDVQMFGKNPLENSSADTRSGGRFRLTDVRWIPDGLRVKGSIQTEEDSISIDVGEKTSEERADPPVEGIRFRLSNSGGGPAKKFRLWTHLRIHDGPHKGMQARSALVRLDRYSLHKFAENIVQSGEQDLAFQGKIRLMIRDPPIDNQEYGDFHTFDFSEGIQKLVREGTEHIEIFLNLSYEDTFENSYEEQFYTHRGDISSGMDWYDFVSQDYPTITYENESSQQQSYLEKFRSWIDRSINRVRSWFGD